MSGFSMLAMMASIAPREMVLEKLEETVAIYKENVVLGKEALSEEDKARCLGNLGFITLSVSNQGKDIPQIMKEIEQVESTTELHRSMTGSTSQN